MAPRATRQVVVVGIDSRVWQKRQSYRPTRPGDMTEDGRHKRFSLTESGLEREGGHMSRPSKNEVGQTAGAGGGLERVTTMSFRQRVRRKRNGALSKDRTVGEPGTNSQDRRDWCQSRGQFTIASGGLWSRFPPHDPLSGEGRQQANHHTTLLPPSSTLVALLSTDMLRTAHQTPPSCKGQTI
jgi:hypothetical protein